VFGGVGQEGQMARSLDRQGQTPLMAGTRAGPASRLDLPLLGDKAAQHIDVLGGHVIDLVDAERTAPAALEAAPSSGSIGSTVVATTTARFSIVHHSELLHTSLQADGKAAAWRSRN